MWRHYLSTAARGFVRHRLYSAINVVGLAIGLTCIIFVVLFVRDELSYDQWIPGTGNVYRLELAVSVPGRGLLPLAVTPYPMPAVMHEQIPGVTGMTRLYSWPVTLTSGNRQFAQQVDIVDPDFFEMIRLPLIMGDAGSVLRQPESVVLTESAARQYFGNADPIGKSLTTDAGNCSNGAAACPQISLRVTGVVRDLPHDTQLSGNAFIPATSLANPISPSMRQDWLTQSGYGYVRLAPGVDPARVAAAMPPIFDQDLTPVLTKYAGIHILGSKVYAAHLTPFAQVHLASSRWQYNLTPPGSWSTLYGVAAIGTVLVALLSLTLALALAEVLLPLFDDFLQRPLALHYLTDWKLLLLLTGIAVMTGLISGSYPALILSGLRPVTGLRAGGAAPPRSAGLRNVLVVAQFAVSVGMGIAAAVIFRQVSYARAMDLGFQHEYVLILNNGGLTGEKQEAFAQALRANPGVAGVGLSNIAPFDSGESNSLLQVPGQSELHTINTTVIGPGYSDVYGIPLIAGRLLSAGRGVDQLNSMGIVSGGDPLNEGRNILLNAAAARELGFDPRQAVGRTVLYNHNHVRIVGVIADTKLQGARQPVAPMIYVYIPSFAMSFSVRLDPGRIPQTLGFIDRTWHAFSPTVAVQRRFLDWRFDDLYRLDEREGAMLGVFVILAVMIGCLGLYGLAVFTAERRTKEIGIRKVSGARTADIVRLMLWRISVPVLVALLVAWTTVCGNTLRLARASPVHALRYE